MGNRTVESIVSGREVMEGAGVRIRRVLSQAQQRRLDPFLMLDIFRSDDPSEYLAGFPDHPHRGFETVTYMIAGRMRHRDSAGHEGLLESGGVQWMTAGRGIVHSEMPELEIGLLEGFQLWLNLPADRKMTAPWYRDFQAGDIPELMTPAGVTVRVIAGESQGVAGAVTRPDTEPILLDLHLPPGSRFAQALPPTHNTFLVVYRGKVTVADDEIGEGKMAILGNSPAADTVVLDAPQAATRVLLIAGRPLAEQIVQHGPFVMNSQEQIVAAIRDYQTGQFFA